MANTHDESQSLQHLDSLERRLGRTADQAELPEIEERTAPGLLRYMPQLIREFWGRKAYFTMERDGTLSMDGFYKNGPMRLEVREGDRVVAVDKRGRETPISSFEDLVQLNFLWWKQSNTKTTYVDPGRPWIENFIERNMVRRKVIFQPASAEDDDAGQD